MKSTVPTITLRHLSFVLLRFVFFPSQSLIECKNQRQCHTQLEVKRISSKFSLHATLYKSTKKQEHDIYWSHMSPFVRTSPISHLLHFLMGLSLKTNTKPQKRSLFDMILGLAHKSNCPTNILRPD